MCLARTDLYQCTASVLPNLHPKLTSGLTNLYQSQAAAAKAEADKAASAKAASAKADADASAQKAAKVCSPPVAGLSLYIYIYIDR